MPLNITYQATYGDIMVHINKNDNCETRQVPRTITINNGCSCNNLSRYPFNTISLTCGLNTITNAQYAGEYNRTTGYIAERLYEYNSSFPSYYLTLRSALDNSIIVEGFSPLFITYQNFMGDIEMHVNSNSFCGGKT